ncbi:MAG: HEAT repeat domain-containing protein [Gemmataceae bacterium]
MRCLLGSLFVVLLPQGIPAAHAAEEPRVLLERALKARGGVEAVQKRVAVRVKVKGTFHGVGAIGDIRVEGEMWEFGPRGRIELRIGDAETRLRYAVVFDGDKSWRVFNGQIQNFDKEDLASLRISEYVDRVTELADLLTDKGFTFAQLADAQVEGRPARGLKISCKDRPDISLYFDKKTGLLVKYSYRAPRFGGAKEVLHETVLSDYREADLASADEKLVREAKSDVTGPALLAFLRKRTPTSANLDRTRALIAKLGDDAFEVREQASRDLIALGAIAIPFLRKATKNNDREIVRRARECLQTIGEERSKVRIAAVIRLLGLRKPEGAAEVLLNYLSSADADVAKETRAALYAVALAKREPDPVLLRALDDKNPLRRRAAAAVLGKDGGAYARQPGRRLFATMPKRPRKHKTWIDGKLDIEMESFDYQFFNAFEDKVFARP